MTLKGIQAPKDADLDALLGFVWGHMSACESSAAVRQSLDGGCLCVYISLSDLMIYQMRFYSKGQPTS